MCLNDEEISWLNLDQLFRAVPNVGVRKKERVLL